MAEQTNESTPDQPLVYSVVGKLFGGGVPAPLPASVKPAAPERQPVTLRSPARGIAERATVPAEVEEERAFFAKVASMKYVFGKPKPDDTPAPVTATGGAMNTAEPTLLSKLTASAPTLQPPPFLSKRSDVQPKAAESTSPEHATKPRSSSLIERMLDGEKARAAHRMKVATGEAASQEQQPPDEKWGWFGNANTAPSEEAATTDGTRAANLAQAREADQAPESFMKFTRIVMGGGDSYVTGPAPVKTKQNQVELNTKVSMEAPEKKYWNCLPEATKRWGCPAFTGGSW